MMLGGTVAVTILNATQEPLLLSWTRQLRFMSLIAGSFKSQLIDYFRGAITSWELVEGSLWQFYDNET